MGCKEATKQQIEPIVGIVEKKIEGTVYIDNQSSTENTIYTSNRKFTTEYTYTNKTR